MTLWKWSQVAANNGSADSTCPFPEGMAPSALNDGTRGMMAALAKWRDDISGLLVTTGNSAGYILTTNEGLANPPTDGQMLAFTPHVTNTGNNIIVDGSAATIQTQVGAIVPPGTLIASTPYRAKYNAAANAWVLEGFYGNPYNIPLLGGIDYWGPTAPNSSFVFPVGQAISRTVYSGAFSLLGTTFGAGDGSTTFNLPDKRGRVSAGVDNMGGSSGGQMPGFNLGVTGGAITHTLSVGEVPALSFSGTTGAMNANASHSHSASASTIGIVLGGSGPGQAWAQANASAGATFVTDAKNVDHGHPFSGSTSGGGGAHSILQPTIACNYIMRII